MKPSFPSPSLVQVLLTVIASCLHYAHVYLGDVTVLEKMPKKWKMPKSWKNHTL